MTSKLLDIFQHPIVVAPMGGGPSTPRLVVAAAEAGAVGFLAAGYKTAEQVDSEIASVRAATSRPFGVNLFVPGMPFRDRSKINDYVRELVPEAASLDVELGAASWDDDGWESKTELIVDAAPPLVSFAFGCPLRSILAALQQRGTLVIVTVTTPEEAQIAAHVGADFLCIQGIEAGAHRGSFANDPLVDGGLETMELLSAVKRVTACPLIAAGGIGLPIHVERALKQGAVAVQAGTAFLRCIESGAHPLHKQALVDPAFSETAFTRSYSGRPARGLLNRLMRRHPRAPAAYPEVNNATRPLRAAAAAKSDPGAMSLWAGTGHRHARDSAAAEIIEWLTSTLS